MKKYCLVTTYYGKDTACPSKENTKSKFRYDGHEDDLYINFSDTFDPWNTEHLSVGYSHRKDLIYGKIFLLKDFIESNILNKYEFLCHIDYGDVKFSRSFIDMMEKFHKSEQDFCIATEKTCWPYIETVQQWLPHKIDLKEFEYINSGCILSKTEIFYKLLTDLIDLCLNTKINFWDDQGVWQYYNLVVEKLSTDISCEYFFCTALLDETFYSIEDNKIKTKFNTYPYLIHDNSSFSLNLTNKL
jgi:hypothetical protein